jgi:hypothetical protein
MIKILMSSFIIDEKPSENNRIEFLDVSNNKFGYSGIEAISKMLPLNKSIRVLNLFHNLFDVNGARRLRDALKVNSTIEAIDIGYNRFKGRGFGYIIDGLTSNPNNKLTYLGSKYNFLKHDSLITNLPRILTSPNSHINHLEISSNGFDNKTLSEAYNLLGDKSVNIDIFEKLYYLVEERLERTVWISPLNRNDTSKMLYDAIKDAELDIITNDDSHLGIPLLIGFKRGRRIGQKKDSSLLNGFIEFIHPNSVNRLLKLAASGGTLMGRKFRMYKAGTKPEQLIVKRKKIT